MLVKPTMAKMHSGLLYSGGFLLENILWLSMAFLFTRMHNAEVRICLLEIKDPLQISKATPSGSWFLNNWVSMSLYTVVQGFCKLLNTRVVHGYLLLITSVPWRIRFNDVGIFSLKKCSMFFVFNFIVYRYKCCVIESSIGFSASLMSPHITALHSTYIHHTLVSEK